MININVRLKCKMSGDVVNAVLCLDKDDDLEVINKKFDLLEAQLFRNRNTEHYELDRSELDKYLYTV